MSSPLSKRYFGPVGSKLKRLCLVACVFGRLASRYASFCPFPGLQSRTPFHFFKRFTATAVGLSSAFAWSRIVKRPNLRSSSGALSMGLLLIVYRLQRVCAGIVSVHCLNL